MSATDRPKKEEFVPLYEKLVAHGFDLGMLIKDDFFVSSRFSPNTTLIEAFQLAAMGGNSLNIPYFWHYRKKHRKRNPASISILDRCKSGDWYSLSGFFIEVMFVKSVVGHLWNKGKMFIYHDT